MKFISLDYKLFFPSTYILNFRSFRDLSSNEITLLSERLFANLVSVERLYV